MISSRTTKIDMQSLAYALNTLLFTFPDSLRNAFLLNNVNSTISFATRSVKEADTGGQVVKNYFYVF